MTPPNQTDLSRDPQDDALISFSNGTGESAANITNTSLFYISADGVVFEGGSFQITNGRYVFHPETNGVRRDSITRFYGLKATHNGNSTAVNINQGA